LNVYAVRVGVGSGTNAGSSNISTVTAANNTIVLSKSNLSLPDVNLYGVYDDVQGTVFFNPVKSRII
jgi:hypothetical protein